MKKWHVLLALVLMAPTVQAGGAKEAAAAASGGSGRGEYLAGQGIIVPPDEVHIDSYIASLDYLYPDPDQDFGVSLYAGHRQVSNQGQRELIQIGIQGKRHGYGELPPMNLAFVIDKSGSMGDRHKMEWVKEAFDVFVARVRDIDFVSLIVFDSSARVVFRSTQMSSERARERFRRAVLSVKPGGGTNLIAGLELGYEQVMANYRQDYTNRVLFLTDGVGKSEGILEMAREYAGLGVNVSTIGLGEQFNLELMVDLAVAGGGSSRFVSDREGMEKIFGSDLDRMVVPGARDLRMTLELAPDLKVLGTWGYEHRDEGRRIRYRLPTLHHRDYETILVEVEIPPQAQTGIKELARFQVDYRDLEGNPRRSGPFSLEVRVVDAPAPVTGISDAMVLKSGTMLHFAQALQRIGRLYYESPQLETWREAGVRPPAAELVPIRQALDVTAGMRRELLNARLRLDNIGFDDELKMLDQYARILGADLKLDAESLEDVVADEELRPIVADRPISEHLGHLFQEIGLELVKRPDAILAVSEFAMKGGKQCSLVDLINETATTELAGLHGIKVVERTRLETVLREQELAVSDLVDTNRAIRVGELLSAGYIVTGTVVEMSTTVVIFGRVINVATGEVESAAQVVVPKNEELRGLLI
jgi:Mg-chelatase subunit ChlD/TolB-like protein